MNVLNVLRSILMVSLISAPASAAAPATFERCTIIARSSTFDGALSKWYLCDGAPVLISGVWQYQDGQRLELGQEALGETADFGVPPPVAGLNAFFTGCYRTGERGNFAGFMTQELRFQCDEGPIALRGAWSVETQGSWQYHLQLGEVDLQAEWVGDRKQNAAFLSRFDRYCSVQFGYRLCGWSREPRK